MYISTLFFSDRQMNCLYMDEAYYGQERSLRYTLSIRTHRILPDTHIIIIQSATLGNHSLTWVAVGFNNLLEILLALLNFALAQLNFHRSPSLNVITHPQRKFCVVSLPLSSKSFSMDVLFLKERYHDDVGKFR